MDFSHYTDQPVRLAVELVNTLNPSTGADQLTDPDDLRRLLAAYGRDEPVELAHLEEARALRHRLRGVFEADDHEEAAAILNEVLREAGAVPSVSFHGGAAHLHFEPPRPEPVRWLAATAAMGLAVVLVEYGRERLGFCDASDCRDVYVDTSRNRSRRYCSDTCTTRENVAAYRRRRREGA